MKHISTASGSKPLLSNYVSIADSRAHLLDLDSGDTSVLLAGYYELADWDHTGERLLVGLEDGLHFLNVATGDTEPVDTGSTADAYGRWARKAEAWQKYCLTRAIILKKNTHR